MNKFVAVFALAVATVAGTASAANALPAGSAERSQSSAGLPRDGALILAQAWGGDPGRGGDGGGFPGVPGGRGGASGAAGGGNPIYGVAPYPIYDEVDRGISRQEAVYIARQNGVADVDTVRTRRATIKVVGYDYADERITVIIDRYHGGVVDVY